MTYPFPSLMNIVVNCRTQKDSDEFADLLNSLDYKWTDGSKIDKESMCWILYKEKAAYNILQGTQGDVDSFINNGFSIIDFKDFKRAFISSSRKRWKIETLFDPQSKNYRYRLFYKRLFKKKYLKDLEGNTYTLSSLEDALLLSKFLKVFNLNSSFYATKN